MAAATESRNQYLQGNVFQKILKGELPSKKVFEDANTYAFADINPVAPVHILVIPKKEYFSFNDFAAKASAEEVSNFFKVVQKVAAESGSEENGYRIVMNHGMFAGQVVPHFHAHILGGRVLGAMTTIPDHQVDHGRVHKKDHHDEKHQ